MRGCCRYKASPRRILLAVLVRQYMYNANAGDVCMRGQSIVCVYGCVQQLCFVPEVSWCSVRLAKESPLSRSLRSLTMLLLCRAACWLAVYMYIGFACILLSVRLSILYCNVMCCMVTDTMKLQKMARKYEQRPQRTEEELLFM